MYEEIEFSYREHWTVEREQYVQHKLKPMNKRLLIVEHVSHQPPASVILFICTITIIDYSECVSQETTPTVFIGNGLMSTHPGS